MIKEGLQVDSTSSSCRQQGIENLEDDVAGQESVESNSWVEGLNFLLE